VDDAEDAAANEDDPVDVTDDEEVGVALDPHPATAAASTAKTAPTLHTRPRTRPRWDRLPPVGRPSALAEG